MLRRFGGWMAVLGLGLVGLNAQAVEFRGADYDVYIGDEDGDGVDDIYLVPRDIFVPIHGEILIPLLVKSDKSSFLISSSASDYIDPVIAEALDTSGMALLVNGLDTFDHDGDGVADLFIDKTGTMHHNLVISGNSISSPEIIQSNLNYTKIGNTALIGSDPSNDILLEEVYKGRLTGKASTNADGSFSYRIPIEVPPGINGAEPNFSVDYNSNHRNGILGWGWNLSNLSSITRCQATPVRDNEYASINSGDNYKYCWQGQRLVEVASGEYRTEKESFTKITRHGSAISPDYWTVYKPNGAVLNYGLNEKARVVDGQDQNMSWSISRSTDINGNYVDYKYVRFISFSGLGRNFPLINTISYTKNDSEDAADLNNSIEFHFEERPDDLQTFSAGANISTAYRLKRIDVKSNSSLVRNYQFDYQIPGETYFGKTVSSTLNTSRLASITLCFESLTNCAPANEINWGDIEVQLGATSHQQIESTDLLDRSYTPVALDLNNDGLEDLLWTFKTSNSVGYKAALSNGNGTFRSVNPPDTFINEVGAYPDEAVEGVSSYWRSMTYDHNGDGHIDLLFAGEVGNRFEIYTALGRGDGTFEYPLPGGGNTRVVGGHEFGGKALTYTPFPCQCNDDLKEDVVFIRTNIGTGWAPAGIEVYTLLSNGNGTFQQQINTVVTTAPTPLLGDGTGLLNGDFNGDGIGDFLRWSLSGPSLTPIVSQNMDRIAFDVVLGDGQGSFNMKPRKVWQLSDVNHKSHVSKPVVADVNNDGFDDVVSTTLYLKVNDDFSKTREERRFYVNLSHGDGTFEPPASLGDLGLPLSRGLGTAPKNQGLTIADCNGDGFKDLINYEYHESKIYVAYGLGDGHFEPYTQLENDYFDYQYDLEDVVLRRLEGDFNGDGYADLAMTYMGDAGLGVYISQSNLNPNHNRVTELRDGLGNSTQVVYSNLADRNVYKGHISGSADIISSTGFGISATKFNGFERSVINYNSSLNTVVKKLNVSNGIGGFTTQDYKYKGALIHRRGFGNLGFSKIQKTTSIDGWWKKLVDNIYYHQDVSSNYLLVGEVKRHTRYTSEIFFDFPLETLISDTQYQRKVRLYSDDIDSPHNSPHYFSYAYRVKEKRYDLNGRKIADLTQENFSQVDSNCLDSDLTKPCFAAANSANDIDYHADGTLLYSRKVTEDASESSASLTIDTIEYSDIVSRKTNDHWVLGLKGTEKVSSSVGSSVTDQISLTRTKDYTYYDNGRLHTEIVEPGNAFLSITNTYEYNDYGSIETFTQSWNNSANDSLDFSSRVTYIDEHFDDGERVVTKTNPIGQSETTIYEPKFGLARYFYDVNGLMTNSSFNSYGWLDSQTYYDGTTSEYDYRKCVDDCFTYSDNEAWYTQIKTTGKSAERVYYDALDRQVGTRNKRLNGAYSYTAIGYDSQGNQASIVAPFSQGDSQHVTQHSYDILNRIIRSEFADSSFSTVTYNGLNKTYRNRLGQEQTRQVNGKNWVMRVTDNLNTPVDYTYWPFGDLKTTKVNNNTDTTVTITYDLWGQKLSLDDPNSGLTHYKYNPLGLLDATTDAKGQKTQYTYDRLGRVIERIDNATASGAANRTHTWVFDNKLNGKGKLGSVTGFDTNGAAYSKNYTYTAHSELNTSTTSLGGNSYTVTHWYDDFNREVGLTYPTGYSIAYAFNEYGYFSELKDAESDSNLWRASLDDPRGNITQFTLGNGSVTDKGFDPITGRIETIRASKSNLDIMDHTYNFDSLGNLEQRIDALNNLTQNFCYDGLNRLVSERFNSTCQGVSDDYTYDALGNISAKYGVLGPYQYGDNAGPNAVTAANGMTYQYDANGNLITARVGINQTIKSVTYSAFNKPTRLTFEDQWTDIIYGPNKDRIKRHDSSGRNSLYIDGLYEEVTNNGTTQKIHYIEDFGLYIQRSGSTNNSEYVYLYKDHLGSIVAKSYGALSTTNDIEWLSNGSWGERRVESWNGLEETTDYQASDIARGFTGHEHLDGVGLIHMNGRVYDPVLGRFVSPDPLIQAPYNSQSYNRYSYVFNNPLSFTDPSGFQAEDLEEVLVTGNRTTTNNGFGSTYACPCQIGSILYQIIDTYIGKPVGNGLYSMVHGDSTENEGSTASQGDSTEEGEEGTIQIGDTELTEEDLRQKIIEVLESEGIVYSGGPGGDWDPKEPEDEDGRVSRLEDLNGKTPRQADKILRDQGFKPTQSSPTKGGWRTYKHPDGSKVDIHSSGRVVRSAKPIYNSSGARINKGQRIDYNGNKIPLSLDHKLHPAETLKM